MPDFTLYIELFGYLGSALVVLSMLMTSVVKLRVVNLIGSFISGTYALIIGSIPLCVMNLCLIVINVINLVKLFKPKEHYTLVEGDADESVVRFFLERHGDDISRFFPAFEDEKVHANRAFFVFCGNEPAGILLAETSEKGVLDILLDYTTPTYRDCSVAKHLYESLPKHGIRKVIFSRATSGSHADYLEKMGFQLNQASWEKTL